jgi:hypothetical protein
MYKLKTAILILLISLTQLSHAQQFSFTELLTMTKSQRNYEQRMIAIGNDLIEKHHSENFTYSTQNGDWGSCDLIPTDDVKMQAIYKFTDGTIMSETKLDSMYTKEQRNDLFESDAVKLVEGPQNKYKYIPNLETYSFDTALQSDFAKNYDRIEESFYTRYSHVQMKYLKKGIGPATYSNSLMVTLTNNSDYKNLVKQIQIKCEFGGIINQMMCFTYLDPITKKLCGIQAFTSQFQGVLSYHINIYWNEWKRVN